jgi:hypothetical protein
MAQFSRRVVWSLRAIGWWLLLAAVAALVFVPQPPPGLVYAFVAVVVGWALLAWLTEVDRPQTRDPAAKFVRRLLHSSPIEPQYDVAENIEEGGGTFFMTDAYRRFFQDFDQFAELMNGHFKNSPWRLQQIGDPFLKNFGDDYPQHGRRYDVFYNQVCIGDLEINPDFKYDTRNNPLVRSCVKLADVRLLPFDEIYRFLLAIAHNLSGGASESFAEAKQAIDTALLRALWDANPWGQSAGIGRSDKKSTAQLVGAAELTWRTSGSAAPYLEWRKRTEEHRADAQYDPGFEPPVPPK